MSQLCPQTLQSPITLKKWNPWTIRTNMPWPPAYLLPLNSYYFLLCSLCSCQTSFLAFLPTYQTGSQCTRSWLIVFTFTIPSAWIKFLQDFLLHSGFCFPQNSLSWLIYLNSPCPITLTPLTLCSIFSKPLSFLHITDLFISCFSTKI